MQSDGAFPFSGSLVPSRRRNDWKSFNCQGKYFAKEDFRAPPWTWRNVVAGTKRAIPSGQYRSIMPARGSQSQYGIWFILPACGAIPCFIINLLKSLQKIPVTFYFLLLKFIFENLEVRGSTGKYWFTWKRITVFTLTLVRQFYPTIPGNIYLAHMSWINLYMAVSQSDVFF